MHELLKLVTYLSILTLSTTSSSHLSRESYSSNQRASPQYSFPTGDVYAPSLYDNNNNNGEDVGWIGYENSMDSSVYSRKPSQSSSSDYLIPSSYMNVGASISNNHPSSNRISSSISSNNNRNGGLTNIKSSTKRGKKDSSRFNALKMSRSQQLDEPQRKKSNSKISNKNATENIMQNPDESDNRKLNKASSKLFASSQSSSSSAYTNEFPQSPAISSSKEREIQQLFGVQNAQIFRKHQMQPSSGDGGIELPTYSKDKAVVSTSDDAIDIKDSQKKRSNGDRKELVPDMSSPMTSHLMSRTTRRQREYDVPLIRECLFQTFYLLSFLLCVVYDT